MSSMILPFEMAPQQGGLLCWAAVAVSLRRFYRKQESIDQIAFARSLLGANCNQVCQPLRALNHAGLRYREHSGPIPLADIEQQLMSGHPVLIAARYFIGWHLLVLHGIGHGTQMMIADSLHGPSRASYADLTAAYREHYLWSHTYCLAPAGDDE
ncbi:papain-like cysteine protease family protein [Massilia scottii]|uniref:papain-like cysteine protease family protein n=1 Tax=Massilia scottii TaxID=3057166 RepID=UPI0027969FBB|nr:papain-like cysteine protease family protein [Massilia sp. CCM 9029]MDQ1830782.1 papain-like cysteine protease family protein [Massilia sp. CCM 9029]